MKETLAPTDWILLGCYYSETDTAGEPVGLIMKCEHEANHVELIRVLSPRLHNILAPLDQRTTEWAMETLVDAKGDGRDPAETLEIFRQLGSLNVGPIRTMYLHSAEKSSPQSSPLIVSKFLAECGHLPEVRQSNGGIAIEYLKRLAIEDEVIGAHVKLTA